MPILTLAAVEFGRGYDQSWLQPEQCPQLLTRLSEVFEIFKGRQRDWIQRERISHRVGYRVKRTNELIVEPEVKTAVPHQPAEEPLCPCPVEAWCVPIHPYTLEQIRADHSH